MMALRLPQPVEIIFAVSRYGLPGLAAECQRGELLVRPRPVDVDAAEAAFELALATARDQRTKRFELCAATNMGRLWRDQGKRQQAHDLLAPVHGWFTDGFDTLDLKEAKALLSYRSSH